MRPSLISGRDPVVVLFSRILMSMSTSAQASWTAPQDYNAEAKAKFPLPLYPQEDDYEDPVLYEADCKRYQESKLKVLDTQDAWREWEQVADLAHAAYLGFLETMCDCGKPLQN